MLITGATGFIGRHLHRHLLDLGYAVRVLVRPRRAPRDDLDPRCDVHTGALTDPQALARALEGAGSVVYGAGAVRGRRLSDFLEANVAGVETLAEALRDTGRTMPVMLLSSLAASRPELSHYARSKRCAEEVLRRHEDIAWTILRPPAVYGPGDREMRGILELARRGLALRAGPVHQRLALLHVDDLVRAVAAWLQHPGPCRHRCFGIDDGTPGGYRWHDIGLAVARRPVREVGVPGWLLKTVAGVNAGAAGVLGYAPMLTPGKVRELQQSTWLCDNAGFTHATGWHPQIDLAHGAAALFADRSAS